MNISEQREKSKQSGKNVLAKGLRDLKSPIGVNVLSTIVIYGIVLMLIDYIGKRIGISQSIMTMAMVIIIASTIVILSVKVSSATKESIKRRKEAYERKFGSSKRNDRSR